MFELVDPARRLVSLVAVTALLCSTLVLVLGAMPARAAVEPAPNPDLNKACGLDVLVLSGASLLILIRYAPRVFEVVRSDDGPT